MSWVRRALGLLQAVKQADKSPTPSRVLWLGLLCWALSSLLPTIHRAGQLPRSAFWLLPLAPALLALGLWLTRGHGAAATYTLLAAFPTALALSMSRFPHELALATFSPLSLLFSLLSLLAYAASASQLAAAHDPERGVDHKPLGEVAPVDAEGRRQKVGSLVLGFVTAGCVVAVCFASWQAPLAYREQWGRAARQGAVLTALCAGLVGCLAISMVAPGLRAERKRSKRRDERGKQVLRLLLSALSFALLYVLARR